MGNIETFFFDTYAFHELIKGNRDYAPYRYKVGVVTTKLQLMELHYTLMLKHGKAAADFYYDEFARKALEVSDDVIKEASKFKLEHKRRRLSYVDCIGYVFAKSLNIKFLTGDKEFGNLENVEFVK